MFVTISVHCVSFVFFPLFMHSQFQLSILYNLLYFFSLHTSYTCFEKIVVS